MENKSMWKMTKEEEHSWKMRKLLSKAMESAMNNPPMTTKAKLKFEINRMEFKPSITK